MLNQKNRAIFTKLRFYYFLYKFSYKLLRHKVISFILGMCVFFILSIYVGDYLTSHFGYGAFPFFSYLGFMMLLAYLGHVLSSIPKKYFELSIRPLIWWFK